MRNEELGDGRWTMDDGWWMMDDGRWTMVNDRQWMVDDGERVLYQYRDEHMWGWCIAYKGVECHECYQRHKSQT